MPIWAIPSWERFGLPSGLTVTTCWTNVFSPSSGPSCSAIRSTSAWSASVSGALSSRSNTRIAAGVVAPGNFSDCRSVALIDS